MAGKQYAEDSGSLYEAYLEATKKITVLSWNIYRKVQTTYYGFETTYCQKNIHP